MRLSENLSAGFVLQPSGSFVGGDAYMGGAFIYRFMKIRLFQHAANGEPLKSGSPFFKNFAFEVRLFLISCTCISEAYFMKNPEGVLAICMIPQDAWSLSKGGCAK